MKKLSIIVLLSLSTNLLSSHSSYAKELKINNQQIFSNIERQIELLKNNGNNITLIDLYRNNGQDSMAINIAQSILKKEPYNYDVAYKLSELYIRNFYLNEAESLLYKIPGTYQNYNNVLVSLMSIYISKKDKEKADNLLNANKNDLLLSAIYDYSPFGMNPTSSRKKIEEYLKSNPNNKIALFYMGSILLDNNEVKEARDYLKKAITIDPFYSRAYSVLGYLEAIDSKKVGAGSDDLKTALRTNPLEYRSLLTFGNGTTDTNYDLLEKDNENLKSSEYFLSENRKITNLLNQGKNKEAEATLKQIMYKYPNNIHSFISEGNYYINIGEYRKAIDSLKKARDISPEYGVANNTMAFAINSLIKSQEKKLKNFNIDLYDYSKIDIENLKKVFINFDDIPKKYQKVVFYSVYPVKQYLPVLAASGASHYIIPLYEKSTDQKFGNELKGKTSFDGRLWDDIRGRGGFNSATGIESLEDTINFEFNTLTHEFAHQIHGYAFTKDQQSKISMLYEKAKKESKFLDYYAASNDYEYFAQGVEAYNSTQGKLTLKATAKNTPEFLKSKDMDLYNFIDKVSANPVTNDNYAAAYLQAASISYFNNDSINSIYNYEKAVEVKPSDLNTYLLLGNAYFQSGNILKSIDTYNKVIASDKNSSYGYIGLADNYLFSGDFLNSQTNFEKGLSRELLSADAYASFARMFLEKGDYNSSQEYINKALKVESENALTYSVKALLNADKLYFNQAFEDIDKAIKFDPGNGLYKIRKAYVLAKSGAVIKAYQEIKDIESTYNNNLPVTYEYDEKKGKYYYYNIKDMPSKAEYYYTLGLIKEIEKNYNDASKNYLKALEVIPQYYKPKKKLNEIFKNIQDINLKKEIEKYIKV